MSETVHGTAVLADSFGVLIRGSSGAGKSTLAAAIISRSGRLVADDRVHLSVCHGRLIATGVRSTAGMLELRGRGVISLPYERSAVIRLLVDIRPASELERLPADEELSASVFGLVLPRQAVSADTYRALMLVDAALSAVPGRRDAGLRSSPV